MAKGFNDVAYDCRRKCAGKGGGSLNYCASEYWWGLEAARATRCSIPNYEYGETEDLQAVFQFERGYINAPNRYQPQNPDNQVVCE